MQARTLVLALAYGVVNPPFESPDELLHFDYVEALLRTRRLPVAQAELSEYHQPPLYYMAGALAQRPGCRRRAGSLRGPAQPVLGVADRRMGVDNKSQFVHGPEQDYPYAGLWLRLHLLRVFSTLLGLATVWLMGDLALLVRPDRYDVAALTTAFVAFLPQFLFLASSVSNDVPAVAASLLLSVTLGCFLREPRPRRAVFVGLALGGAVLVKMSLLIVCALAIGICPRLTCWPATPGPCGRS